MQLTGQPVLRSEEWRALVHGDPPRYIELARRLDADDISALIEHLAMPVIQEQTAAIGLLHAFVKHENVRVTGPQREQLLAKLKAIMPSYPAQPGQAAFIFMCLLDRSVAEQFLLEEVHPSRIPETYFRHYLVDLKRARSQRAVDRIVGYSKFEGEKGETATRFLKTLGIIDAAEIVELAAKWRESKSVKYLNDLYVFHIAHQGGKPLSPLLQLLGPWNHNEFNGYRYDSVEGPSLFLREDEQANLVAFKLK